MRLTLADLASRCDLEPTGTTEVAISGVCGLSDDLPDCVSFIANPDQVAAAARSRIPAFVTRPDALIPGKHNLLHQNPEIAICRVAALFAPVAFAPSAPLATDAIIATSAQLGADVVVGPGVVIGERVVIGARTRLLAGCVVLDDACIGADCLLYPRVVIRECCQLGDRVIIQPGAIIGGDGFGFVVDAVGNPIKVPQIGRVIIGDDVEIGANSTVDRARFTDTVIGRGTKIDNLVIVAHNVHIGENCLIAAQCGIAGSSRLGNRVRLGGQVGVIGHLGIADDVVVLAQSLVSKSLDRPGVYAGTPAIPAQAWRTAVARFRRAGRSRGC